MEPRDSIKDDVKQEYKYILHSQRTRKGIEIVGNLKSIQCTFTCPLLQCGDIVNHEVSFNIVFCLLSDDFTLPPLVLTKMDELNTVNEIPFLKARDTNVSTTKDETSTVISEIPVLKVKDINFTQWSFQYWLESVWQKRNRRNIRSLLVTSMDLPFGVTKFLKKCNTELMILPDIIAADIEPLGEAWSKNFISEITKSYVVWGQEFYTVKLPLEILCRMIHSVWSKCNTAANFDKLFLMDEDNAVASILEDQLTQQKDWMKEPDLMTQDPEFILQRIELFRCSSCVNVFPIEELKRHAHNKVSTPRKLIGIGRKMYFTCFIEHDNGALICEICAKDFSKKCWAVHHILKHLQQKWCSVCFKQLFVCQKHTCLQKENEPSVFAQEQGFSAICEDQQALSKYHNTSKVLSTHHKYICEGNHLEDTLKEGISNLELLEVLSENENYFLNENESDKSGKPPQSYFEPAICQKMAVANSCMCSYCHKKLSVPAKIVTHNCYPETKISKLGYKVSRKCARKTIRAPCEFCGKILFSALEITTHLCNDQSVM